MCYNPIRLPDGRKFPCGHCLACLKSYQDQWCARMSEELKCWKSDGVIPPVVFFTLKYSNDKIPCTHLVAHEDGITILGPRVELPCMDAPVYDEWTDTRRETSAEWASRHNSNLDLWSDHLRYLESNSGYDPSVPWLPSKHPETLFSPKFALQFHSVCKKDVQDWLKRGRILAQRRKPEIFNQEFNPRFKSTWIDSDGVKRSLPSSACPKNFKYFITSEYGPNTQRPHYHGVMFGISYAEFEEFFAKDWQSHFGDSVGSAISFSAFDPTRGGMLYVSKYCSKGGYEHPYCAKDFFYNSGDQFKEYHSRRFESCIRDFGINSPLVAPTFHLISKGLGASYCFNSELLDYFAVRLEPYQTESGRLNFRVVDKLSDYAPSIPLNEAFAPSSTLCIDDVPGGIRIRRYSYLSDSERERHPDVEYGYLIGESIISSSAIVDRAYELGVLNKKYNRTYVKNSASGAVHRAWHLIGHNCNEAVQIKTTSIALPRYYRRWLLSPLASAFRTSASRCIHPDLDAEYSKRLREFGPGDPALAEIESLLAADKALRYDTEIRLRKSSQNFMRDSKF